MREVIYETERCITIGSIGSEEDLTPEEVKFIFDPPPQDGKCNCCGRSISELRSYGGVGYPLLGDFTGALLVKHWRLLVPCDLRAEELVGNLLRMPVGDQKREEEMVRLVEQHGKTEIDRLKFLVLVNGLRGASWECRDCIILSTDQYFEKLDRL